MDRGTSPFQVSVGNSQEEDEFPSDEAKPFHSSLDSRTHKNKLGGIIQGAGDLPKMAAIKIPLSPRVSLKRRHSSGSDESVLLSQNETQSEASDMESRVLALQQQLKQRKAELECLRREYKKSHRERLMAKEKSLLTQIQAYDTYIEQIKNELEKESEVKVVKPLIKQPKLSCERRKSDTWLLQEKIRQNQEQLSRSSAALISLVGVKDGIEEEVKKKGSISSEECKESRIDHMISFIEKYEMNSENEDKSDTKKHYISVNEINVKPKECYEDVSDTSVLEVKYNKLENTNEAFQQEKELSDNKSEVNESNVSIGTSCNSKMNEFLDEKEKLSFGITVLAETFRSDKSCELIDSKSSEPTNRSTSSGNRTSTDIGKILKVENEQSHLDYFSDETGKDYYRNKSSTVLNVNNTVKIVATDETDNVRLESRRHSESEIKSIETELEERSSAQDGSLTSLLSLSKEGAKQREEKSKIDNSIVDSSTFSEVDGSIPSENVAESQESDISFSERKDLKNVQNSSVDFPHNSDGSKSFGSGNDVENSSKELIDKNYEEISSLILEERESIIHDNGSSNVIFVRESLNENINVKSEKDISDGANEKSSIVESVEEILSIEDDKTSLTESKLYHDHNNFSKENIESKSAMKSISDVIESNVISEQDEIKSLEELVIEDLSNMRNEGEVSEGISEIRSASEILIDNKLKDNSESETAMIVSKISEIMSISEKTRQGSITGRESEGTKSSISELLTKRNSPDEEINSKSRSKLIIFESDSDGVSENSKTLSGISLPSETQKDLVTPPICTELESTEKVICTEQDSVTLEEEEEELAGETPEDDTSKGFEGNIETDVESVGNTLSGRDIVNSEEMSSYISEIGEEGNKENIREIDEELEVDKTIENESEKGHDFITEVCNGSSCASASLEEVPEEFFRLEEEDVINKSGSGEEHLFNASNIQMGLDDSILNESFEAESDVLKLKLTSKLFTESEEKEELGEEEEEEELESEGSDSLLEGPLNEVYAMLGDGGEVGAPLIAALQREGSSSLWRSLAEDAVQEATDLVLAIYNKKISHAEENADNIPEILSIKEVGDNGEKAPCFGGRLLDKQREAELLRLQQIQIDKEISELEEEEARYFYVRQIPDKPPPPYTPRRADLVAAVLEAATQIWENHISSPPSSFLPGSHLREFLWDLAEELVQEVVPEPLPPHPPWVQHRRRRPQKPVRRKEELLEAVEQEAKILLGVEQRQVRENLITRWSKKKRDHVDEVLIREGQEEEWEWTDLTEEESLIKNNVAESIIEGSITSAVEAIASAFSAKFRELQ